MKLHDMRRQYGSDRLDEFDVPDDPISLFSSWFRQVADLQIHEANAVVLATAHENRPSARVVLLKEFGTHGFVFYTNYESRKGRELEANPYAAMLFYWPELERQVRVEGIVERLSREVSEAYFDSRPEGSRLSAIISPQSQTIPSRGMLETLAGEFLQSGKHLKMPDFWGGYVLQPDRIEFWQGRENRLHDRLVYALSEKGVWMLSRLAP